MEREPPLQLPETTLREARAIKAFAKCEASEAQQDLVYKYLVKKLGMVGKLSIFFGESDVTAFNQGRTYCGLTLVHLSETPMEILKKTCLTLTKQEREEE